MDNLTHSLVGALIGQAGLKKKTGLAMPALIIGANLPDVDAACFFWLEGAEHLGFRRGITHGPPALVLLPLILAGLLYGFDRWQTSRGKRPEDRLPVSFKWLFLLSFIGCLTHPALDWLNVYGIRLLEPFSSQWFYGDTLFIIDIWLWALMGFALWFSLRREKRGGEWIKPARMAIAVALGYIGYQHFLQFGAGYYSASRPAGFQADIYLPGIPIIGEDELIAGSRNNWWLLSKDGENFTPLVDTRSLCRWPSDELMRIARSSSETRAFLFWSRAPFAERAPDGSVLLRDARFYDPRARDRFTVPLPDVECEELPAD